MSDRDQEHLGSLFALEIEGVEMARFTGCSGLSWSTEVVTVQSTDLAGRVVTQKRPGRTSYDDIVLKRGLSSNSDLTDWYEGVKKGSVERHNGSVVIYDPAGTETDRWNFEAGWPSRWSASDLDAGTDDMVIEELTITHEFLERS